MLVAAMIFIVKIFLMLLMIFAVVAVIEWLVKIFQPKNTVDKIYKELKIEDVSELVQIKGNTTDGYYLDFVDDIDKKLQDTIDYLNSTAGVKSGIDKEFLKKMIKTEVVTQMPDLGAEVSEDKGFQDRWHHRQAGTRSGRRIYFAYPRHPRLRLCARCNL